MPPNSPPPSWPLSRIAAWGATLLLGAWGLLAAAVSLADTIPADSLVAPAMVDSARGAAGGIQRERGADPELSLETRLGDLGFENVAVAGTTVAFENRRYRHTVEAMARIDRLAGPGTVAFERRLGLTSAAIVNEGTLEAPRFRVRYPSDPDFPAPPRGAAWPTSRTVDLVVGPLLAYELGRPFQPVQFQFQIEPRIRYNPWPGARATASVVIPVYNDFVASFIHPDVEELRPGLLTLEQFAWVPRVALVSATAGLFGDNRYGISVGAARPFLQGQILLDAQADLTGFIAFLPDGVDYATAEQWSSFAGITWRPPFLDLAFNARIAQFLYGDQGEHVEMRRSMGDVDVTLFAFHSGEFDSKGIKLTLPLPPMTRATRQTVRVQPIERVPLSYRTETETVGLFLTGVASREDFLRQLNTPSLNANVPRYERALGKKSSPVDSGPIDHISLSGLTGFINTPWAGTIKDRNIELSYAHVPKRWSFDGRGKFANEPWTLTLGIVPRVEIGLRFTRIPGLRGGVTDPNSKITTDTDHMASWRLTLLTAKPLRPGLAIGVDDVEGTRRFHSSYAVAGLPFAILHVQNRLSFGYAFHVFTATRHVLDGGFGAFEVSPWRAVAVRIEQDSEKWNAGIGIGSKYGLRLRVAALNLETLSVGVGWTHEL